MSLRRHLGGGGPSGTLARHSDILLAGLVVGIVAMMIIPLPTFLLDLLITTNISLAVILLLVSIYVSDALRIAALPSILLIATLFRLGLNVSSTRLILLQADAGQVISSFGNFVVASNLVVGAVIFLILTLIQFIVIAKGSERVAEVAARFTLDAMPGKQMAIDADVRAGALEMEQARRLRTALQRESQLYGSMDGAMKFVKGDAIAGILITLINIVGGLLVGVLQRGMTASEAGTVYSILTVGDGLVSQIPALLTSTAAGIVVTRVASENEGAHLGQEIGSQILAQPKALAIAAGLLALLALVPGMPTTPFMLLAATVGLVSYARLRQSAPPADRARRRQQTDLAAAEAEPLGAEPLAAVALEVGEALTAVVDTSTADGRLIKELIPGLRELLHAELGITLPGVRVRGQVAELAPDSYQILLGGVPSGGGAISQQRVRVLASPARLAALGISEALPVALPGITSEACELPAAQAERLTAAGLELLDAPTQMVLHLGQLIKANAAELIGIQETQELLDDLEQTHPALVHEVVPRLISLQNLAEVLRRLVEEGISIRNLRAILQALAEWGPAEKDPVVLTEYVRMALKRYISHRYAAEGALYAYLLDPVIEDAVRDSIQRGDRGSFLAMEPQLAREIVQAVADQLGQHQADEQPLAILTLMEVRRYVRCLLELDLPELPVLSAGELLPQVQIKPLGRISI